MIVKDESSNILRCLESVINFIDCAVIVDTGSSDNTIEIIKNFFKKKNVPLDLYQDKWINFGYNRNSALKRAYNKADYILLVDADMELVVNRPEFFKNLNDLSFEEALATQESDVLSYSNVRLVKGDRYFSYKGPTHEYISADFPEPKILIIDKDILFFKDHQTGSNRKDKFQKDVEILTRALNEYPDNQRYCFYLAQSYRDLGQTDNAIKYYEKVLQMNGFIQEKYCACLYLGRLYKEKDTKTSIYYFLKAVEFDQKRIESIVELTDLLNSLKQYHLSNMFYEMNKDYDKNIDNILFKEIELYKNRLEFNYSVSCYYTGKKDIGKKMLKNILESKETSYIIKEQSEKNLSFY